MAGKLVLTRKRGESVMIPSIGLEIHIHQINNHNVVLAFSGAEGVTIDRKEIHERKQDERKQQ